MPGYESTARWKAPRVDLVCATCVKAFRRIARKVVDGRAVFCSRACQNEARKPGGAIAREPKTEAIKYRALALRTHGAICSTCGYSRDRRMLDVHHKDGVRANNHESNLEVLCVWCHALLSRGVPDHRRIATAPYRPRLVQLDRLKELVAAGLSHRAIGQIMGVSHEAVRRGIIRSGIVPALVRTPEMAGQKSLKSRLG
jgi:hypothetical protein